MVKDLDKIRRVLVDIDSPDNTQKSTADIQSKRSKTDIAIELLENFSEIFGEDDELVTKILDKITIDDVCVEIGKYNSRLADFVKIWLRYRLGKCGQYGEEKPSKVQ